MVRAASVTAGQHRDQRRQERSPYVNRPLALAQVLLTAGRIREPVSLAPARLHDTIEDTRTSCGELRGQLGAKVADVVMDATDTECVDPGVRTRLQVTTARRVSRAAWQIELADKACSLRDILASAPARWSLGRRREYFDWAQSAIDRIRGRRVRLERRCDEACGQRP